MRSFRFLALLLLGVAPLAAQIQDGSFESQIAGIGVSYTSPWISSGMGPTPMTAPQGATNVEPGGLVVPPATDPHFPCDGAQWAIIDNNLAGPTAALPSGGTNHAPGAVAEIRQTFVMPNPPIIGFCWTWITSETPGSPYNDFASIDLIDPITGANVVNLLFVDTGMSQPNIPGALGGPAGGPFFVPSQSALGSSLNEVAPAGVKQACLDLTGVVTPGAAYDFVAVSGNGLNPMVSSYLILDGITHACTPAPPPVDQPNTTQASLSFSGSSCGAPGVLPFAVTNPGGSNFTMTTSSGTSAPNTPYAIFYTPGIATGSPGLPSPFGLINLDANALVTGQYGILLDGINALTLLDLLIGNTGATGTLDIPLVSPSTTGLLASLQGIFVDNTSPFGLKLSAATQLNVSGGVPTLPAACVGTTPLPALANPTNANLTVNIAFASGFSFPFYGTLYSDVWVNTHGSVSFGGGDTDFTESSPEMLGNAPRIAGWWDSLHPGQGGTIAYTETGNSFVVSWVGIPEYNVGNSNNFCISLDNNGNIALNYGQMDSADAIVGISPGNGLSSAAPIDLTAGVFFGGPSDAIYEAFTPVNQPDIFTCTSVPGFLQFLPNVPPIAVPGDTGYTLVP